MIDRPSRQTIRLALRVVLCTLALVAPGAVQAQRLAPVAARPLTAGYARVTTTSALSFTGGRSPGDSEGVDRARHAVIGAALGAAVGIGVGYHRGRIADAACSGECGGPRVATLVYPPLYGLLGAAIGAAVGYVLPM